MLLSPAAEEKWEQRLEIIILRFHYLIIKKVVYLKTNIADIIYAFNCYKDLINNYYILLEQDLYINFHLLDHIQFSF